MSVWRDVQEALYQRFVTAWADATPFVFEDDKYDPPAGPWARVSVKSRTSAQGSLGNVGNRRMDRAGVVKVQLFDVPGNGVGSLSDLAELARGLYEGRRFAPHGIRFAAVDIGDEGEIEQGRWRMVVATANFEYDQLI